MVYDTYKQFKGNASNKDILQGYKVPALNEQFTNLKNSGDTTGLNNFIKNLPTKELKSFYSEAQIGTRDLETLPAYVDECSNSFSRLKSNFSSFGAGIKAIGKVMEGIDNIIHRSEKIIERGKEAAKNISELESNYKSHAKTVDDVGERYTYLSNGVKTTATATENLSLSNEEYNEFLNISNQLGEAFPQLISGFDSQGNSILNLGSSAETASMHLESLLKQEEEFKNLKISEDLQKMVDAKYEEVKEQKKDISDLEINISKYKKSIDAIENFSKSTFESGSLWSSGKQIQFDPYIKDIDKIKTYVKDALSKAKIDYRDSFTTMGYDEFGYEVNAHTLLFPNASDEDLNNAIEYFKQNIASMKFGVNIEVEALMSKKNLIGEEIQQSWNSLLPTYAATLKSNPAFNRFDEELQNGIINSLANIDPSALSNDQRKDMSSYLKDTFIYPIAAAKPEIQDAYGKLLTLDKSTMSISKYQDTVDDLVGKIVGNDKFAQKDTKIKFGLAFEITDEDGNLLEGQNPMFSKIESAVADTADSQTKTKLTNWRDLFRMSYEITEEQNRLGTDMEGNVDLNHLPMIKNEDDEFEDYSKLAPKSFDYDEFIPDKEGSFNFNPFDKYGNKIEDLEEYIQSQVENGVDINDLDNFMGSFDSLKEAKKQSKVVKEKERAAYEKQTEFIEKLNKSAEMEGVSSIQYLDKLAAFTPEELSRQYPDITRNVNNMGISTEQFFDYLNGYQDASNKAIGEIQQYNPELSYDDLTSLSADDLQIAYDLIIRDGNAYETFDSLKSNIQDLHKEMNLKFKFDENVEDFNSLISSLNSVSSEITSQQTGKSISLEQYNSEELKEYSSALEYVNGSMQLNQDKVRKLTKAKSEEALAAIKAADAQNKVDYRNNAAQIQALLASSSELTEEQERSLTSLQAQQSTLVTQCDQYAVMSANIREATGSYQEWLNAQNAPEQGDMGTDVLNAVQYIKDTSDPESENYGDIGTTKYETSTAFVIPDNIPEGEVQAYVDKLGTYFKDKSGADKFVGEALDKGLMEYDVDTGKAKVAAGKTMKDFASEFNWTDETMQAMFGVLHDLGGDFDWGDEAFGGNIDNALFETEKSLDIIQTRIAELNGKKIRTPVEEIELQTLNKQLKETQQLKNDLSAQKVYASISLDEEIANADQTLKGLEKDKENGVAVDDSQIADAQKNLQNLLNEKKLLSEPTKVEIQAALADTDNEISTYQKDLSALQEGNYDLSVGVSTDEDAQARIGELNELIGNLNTKKATMQVILETAPTESALNELENTEVQPLNVLLEATDYASETLNNVKNLLNSITSKTVVIETVHRDSTSNKILPKNTESGGHGLNGTFNGSAFAQGDAANPRGQRALIGELGREIVVNPNTGKWRTYGDNGAEFAYIPRNAIVFNHQQSENLLERGFVNGRGTLKGSAFANGNAFASGTGIYYNKDNNTIPTAPPVSSSSASNNSTSQNTEAVEQNTQATDSNTESKEKEAKAYDWVAIKIKRFGEATKEIASSITDFVSSTFQYV